MFPSGEEGKSRVEASQSVLQTNHQRKGINHIDVKEVERDFGLWTLDKTTDLLPFFRFKDTGYNCFLLSLFLLGKNIL